MSYLDRLKKHVSAEYPPDPQPLLPKAPYDSFGSCHDAHFQKTGAAPFDQEWFEERAAIYEYDAGFSRPEAERLAYLEVSKWLH